MTDRAHPRSIDRSRLKRRLGRVVNERMAEIERATQLVLGFPPV